VQYPSSGLPSLCLLASATPVTYQTLRIQLGDHRTFELVVRALARIRHRDSMRLFHVDAMRLRYRSVSTILLLSHTCLWASGCGGGPSEPPADPPPVASVTVTGPHTTIAVGEVLQLTATLRASDQSVLIGRTIVWSSDNEAVATVSGAGVVTGIAQGTVRISAASEGQKGGADLTILSPPDPVASVSVSSLPDDLDPGSTAQLTATLRDAQGTELVGRTVNWSSSAPAIATVSPNGLVRAVSPGSFIISAQSESQSGSATGAVRTLAFSGVFASNSYSCGVTPLQRLYCWGGNTGQFGNGQTGSSLVPVLSGGGEPYLNVSTSRDTDGRGYFTCGVRSGGSLFCWGSNLVGQLGDGTTTDRWSPVPVASGESWRMVSTGNRFACAVTTAGAAYCWGFNPSGELGTGNTTNASTPIAVSGNITFALVSAGSTHACGLATNGSAYCWGSNSEGQLGTGDLVSSTVPVAVSGGHTFTSISAGGRYTCGVTDTQAAYCWGSDGLWGALGTGTHAAVTVPTPVAGGLSFAAVETSGFESVTTHTCGITTEGAAYCWGAQAIGDGSGNMTLVPVLVAGGHTWSSVAAGDVHSCGITTTGVAYCWGYSSSGNLGTGSTEGAPVPAKVAFQQ
jgi:alpha-tubulin suppressor-like RCC1 family protein